MINDYHFKDFIGIFDTGVDCKQYINHFDYLEKTNSIFVDNEGQREFRKDKQAFIHELALPDSTSIFSEYNRLTYECLKLYLHEYNNFDSIDKFQQPYMKIQKTEKTGGFHHFHCENLDYNTCNRVMVSMLYLNDVEEGGETEFLFQSLRLKPKEGTFVIFPGSYTHLHRGNPPISNDKYIVTSWIEKKSPK